MVVQIASVDQFLRPTVKVIEPGLACLRQFNVAAQTWVAFEGGEVRIPTCDVGGPNLRVAFEPPFVLATPDHFFGKLGRIIGPMYRE